MNNRRDSGKVLDVTGISRDNGDEVQHYDWNGGDNQEWAVMPDEPPYVALLARHSGEAHDGRAVSMAHGAPFQQWDYPGGDNQK
jgi:hypothetical protein